MAVTKTTNDVQVIIGVGVPTGGDLVEGGVGISLSADGKFTGLYTSTDGADIKPLQLLSTEIQALLDDKLGLHAQADDSAKLNGKTEAEVATSIIDTITNGAGSAYDTLKELEDAIKGNDTDLATILTTQGTKVDKVAGKSLVDDTEIAKLAAIAVRQDVRPAGSTNTDQPDETAVRTAIDAAVPKIYKY